MTNDIGLNAYGTYNLVYSDKTDGSKRARTGTATGLAHTLTIKHAEFVDSKTKVSGNRTVVRFDQNIVIDAVGTIAPISVYMVVAVPKGSVDISTAVLNNIYAMSLLLPTAGGAPNANMLGLAQATFLNGEQ